MTIEIDITNSPPSSEVLASAKKSATDILIQVAGRKHLYWIGVGLSSSLVVLLLMGLWSRGILSTKEVEAWDGALVLAVVLAVVFALAWVVAWAVAGAGALDLAVVLTVAVTLAAAWFYDHWISAPEIKADVVLSDLMELNAEEHPEPCIEYDRLRSDPGVEAYHQQLAAMGCRPVMAEYHAAKGWVASAESSKAGADKMASARAACSRMMAVKS